MVATTAIEEEPFRRSVVHLLDADAAGALGVILNRPLAADIGDILPDWVNAVDSPGYLFNGGPVEVDGAIAIGVAAPGSSPDGWRAMHGRIGLVDLDGPPPSPGEFDGLRVYAGYAGWSAGQLEAEILEGAWLVVPTEDSDLWRRDTETLWRDVLRRQADDTRFWATLPDDPADN